MKAGAQAHLLKTGAVAEAGEVNRLFDDFLPGEDGARSANLP